MLKFIRRITQEMNAASGLSEALAIVVERVCEAIHVDACSIYLKDEKEQCYALIASKGFNEGVDGVLRIKLHQGLVGLVGEREEPLNVENAPSHPNYAYFPETGEEKYQAFLGVPVIHQRKVLGILVAQQRDSRKFDENEEAFLLTVSSQLGGIIAQVKTQGEIDGSAFRVKRECEIQGIPGAPGVAIGTAVRVFPLADLDAVPDRFVEDIDAEVALFLEALTSARDEMRQLANRLKANLPPEEQALFDAYINILERAGLGDEVIEVIQLKRLWAQAALRDVILQHVYQFESMEDLYLRERATDLRDLGSRVLMKLQAEQKAVPEYFEQTILVGEDITAANLAEVPESKLVGIVCLKGSSNSHVAILARSMGIPTVMGAYELPLGGIERQTVIVDGYHGKVHLSPSLTVCKEFTRLMKEEKELYAGLQALHKEPAVTPDGYHLPLLVNTGLVADIPSSLDVGAEGVGLYRTEVPFMIRDRFPSEEEQRLIYLQIIEAFYPRPVTMRTLDVGGDKVLPYFNFSEENPFLGWRGVRITLDHPEIFLVQLRAMLRASSGLNNLRIMLPMVSSIREIREAKALVEQAYLEVKEEDPLVDRPQVGVMVEVPSAVYQASLFASECDFLSVGSNDLTQYLLAVDRNNSRVANLYDSLHPAVLQALVHIVSAAHGQGKHASICGEMAGDPASVILLLGMGYDSLSLNATSLTRVKWVIRSITLAKAQVLLSHALQMDDPRAIRELLENALVEAGLGGLVRAGK
ncbi:MAG: phosphoenolpyruvate--protein phosphotransferase [Gammaproteobacteria bacterium]